MKIELKQIIDQLSEDMNLQKPYRVAAIVDDETKTIIGWTVAKVSDDGTPIPIEELKCKSIKELFSVETNHILDKHINDKKLTTQDHIR